MEFTTSTLFWNSVYSLESFDVTRCWLFSCGNGCYNGITAYGRTQEKLNGVAGIVANVSQLAPTVLHINEPTEQTELQLKPPVVVKKSFTHCAKPIPPENTTSPESTV